MQIVIEAEAKEIAALVLGVQGRQVEEPTIEQLISQSRVLLAQLEALDGSKSEPS